MCFCENTHKTQQAGTTHEQGRTRTILLPLPPSGLVVVLPCCVYAIEKNERRTQEDNDRKWTFFGKANDTRKRSVLKTETCTGEHAIVCECRVLRWMEERRQKEDEIPVSKDVLSLFLFVFTWQLPLGTYFTFRFPVSVLATFVVTLFRTTFWSFVALSLTLTFKCKKTVTTYTGAEIC